MKVDWSDAWVDVWTKRYYARGIPESSWLWTDSTVPVFRLTDICQVGERSDQLKRKMNAQVNVGLFSAREWWNATQNLKKLKLGITARGHGPQRRESE